ncbi:unnamed protein product [Cyclocybe aegerita]|uniref:NADP-dependent oxidoreductase domain-containing protein n=1 Tax=Cyclocybe aegerita TaxID=1973307 RepID=A0A8S0WWP8_CYCAE|nr:unnamed protein product [Cyclocybe aegerita]
MNAGDLKVKLNTGAYMPIIGTGSISSSSFDLESRQRVKDWLLTALKNGYRHIDTAHLYTTEEYVGQAIRDSGIAREELFVATKLPWCHHGRVKESFEESLTRLGLEYIDLPFALEYVEGNPMPMNPDGSHRTTESVNFNHSWAEMEKLLETGKVKAIGVSNFSIKTLEELFKTAKVVPAVNQVEMHPYLAENALRHYCVKHGIVQGLNVSPSSSPSGLSDVRDDPLIVSLAEKYKVTPTQVIFAWHISRGDALIAKSENNERQKENITIPVISEEDLGKIWHLDRGKRLCYIRGSKPGEVCGWTYEWLGWESFRAKA